MISRDRRRTSTARKRSHRETLERQQQQAQVLQRLWKQAKAEAKTQTA
jgi:hypothetical protein